MNSVINRPVAASFTCQWLASTLSAPAMVKAGRNDIRPSPIFTSPDPLSHALRMTSSVPRKFSSDASKPVRMPSSASAFVIFAAWLTPASAMPQRMSGFSRSLAVPPKPPGRRREQR